MDQATAETFLSVFCSEPKVHGGLPNVNCVVHPRQATLPAPRAQRATLSHRHPVDQSDVLRAWQLQRRIRELGGHE